MPGVSINHGGAWVSFVTPQRARHSSNKYFLKSEANKSKRGKNFLISTTLVTWDLLTFTVLTFLNSAQNELPSVRLPTPSRGTNTHWPKNKKDRYNRRRQTQHDTGTTCSFLHAFRGIASPELPSATPVSAAPPRRHRRPAGGASTHSGTKNSRGFEVKRGNVLISTRECGQTEEEKMKLKLLIVHLINFFFFFSRF